MGCKSILLLKLAFIIKSLYMHYVCIVGRSNKTSFFVHSLCSHINIDTSYVSAVGCSYEPVTLDGGRQAVSYTPVWGTSTYSS